MSKNEDEREQGYGMQVSGTAADIATAVTKRNRGMPWSERQVLVNDQITPWEDPATLAKQSQRGT